MKKLITLILVVLVALVGMSFTTESTVPDAYAAEGVDVPIVPAPTDNLYTRYLTRYLANTPKQQLTFFPEGEKGLVPQLLDGEGDPFLLREEEMKTAKSTLITRLPSSGQMKENTCQDGHFLNRRKGRVGKYNKEVGFPLRRVVQIDYFYETEALNGDNAVHLFERATAQVGDGLCYVRAIDGDPRVARIWFEDGSFLDQYKIGENVYGFRACPGAGSPTKAQVKAQQSEPAGQTLPDPGPAPDPDPIPSGNWKHNNDTAPLTTSSSSIVGETVPERSTTITEAGADAPVFGGGGSENNGGWSHNN